VTGDGSILITTRSEEVALSLVEDGDNIIELGLMNESDALLLLRAKLRHDFKVKDAQKLLRALGYMPLAIT